MDKKMEYAISSIVSREVERRIGDLIVRRYCPKCGDERVMANSNEYIDKNGKQKRYRCMICLTLWDKYIGEVKA